MITNIRCANPPIARRRTYTHTWDDKYALTTPRGAYIIHTAIIITQCRLVYEAKMLFLIVWKYSSIEITWHNRRSSSSSQLTRDVSRATFLYYPFQMDGFFSSKVKQQCSLSTLLYIMNSTVLHACACHDCITNPRQCFTRAIYARNRDNNYRSKF